MLLWSPMIIREYIREDKSNPYEKWFSGIGEYRINWGPGYRIYLAQDGKDLILLFGGGTKKNQSADIIKAKGLLKEYKIRKKGEKR